MALKFWVTLLYEIFTIMFGIFQNDFQIFLMILNIRETFGSFWSAIFFYLS